MNKKTRSVLYLVLFMAFLVVATWTVYNVYIIPSKRISESYTQVYQELDEDVSSIVINSVNQHLVIRPSDDQKIHISYYQKPQPSANAFAFSNGKVTLTMIQRVENFDTLFLQNNRPLATITVYLPPESSISIRYTSVEGDVTIEDVSYKSINLSTRSGTVTLSSIVGGGITVSANSGSIKLTQSEFTALNFTSATGNIIIEMNDSLDDCRGLLESTYGILSVNGSRILEQNEEGEEIVVNRLPLDSSTAQKKVTVTSNMGNIAVTSVEPSEEVTEEEQ